MTDRKGLIGTMAAAEAVQMPRTTFWRAYRRGQLVPAAMTPGGQPRWDLADLQRQVTALTTPIPIPVSTPLETYVPDPTSAPVNPPVATAIVTSTLGVLVGRRNDGRPPWTFIAGKIHEGESSADAAIREVKEETGLIVTAGHMPIGERIHPRTGWLMKYMACTPSEGTDVFVGDEEELAEVRWVPSVDALAELMGRENIYPPVLEHLQRVMP